MTLDKSWTKITNKIDQKYIKGALAFAERGERYADDEGRIHCPCKKCVNARKHIPSDVGTHIIHNGFDTSYNVWTYHGEHLPGYETEGTSSESVESENESNGSVAELLDDAFPTGGQTEAENFRDDAPAGDETEAENCKERANLRNKPNVEKLFVDMEKPLYPGLNGRGIGKKEFYNLPTILMKKAIWFIINNCEEIQPYLEEHLQLLRSQHPESADFSEIQHSTFLDWFEKRIREKCTLNPSQINEELYVLSSLPDNRVTSYKGYIVNGLMIPSKTLSKNQP
ncbi:hypothetical protein QVD17_00030 [Tagetes erecta]|uniref:Transposase-associated domain-containing protein n=1 Tax=Tagetes erecta TaxID=13708 RepID=A0AAD8L2L0_TARER|nr:hypothetical protein QVD17_00030 [Tagetes erecta]